MDAKSALLKALLLPGVVRPFAPLTEGRATVFMLHRLRHKDLGVSGVDATAVRRSLSYLRRNRYELLTLEEVFRRLGGNGPPLRRAVAFTIDDGYWEQAEIASPLFEEFDCPVTTFVTTGFLDGRLWFWWDRIEFIFHQTRRNGLSIQIGSANQRYEWHSEIERENVKADFVARCKSMRDADKQAAIERLAVKAEVGLPEDPPPKYAPMSWEDLRRAEGRGMAFAPHTVTHPVLDRVSDAQSRRELVESWQRLRSEARNPVPIFCYPNGRYEDFGAREIEVLRELGFAGAVIGGYGYAEARTFQASPDAPFNVPRFAFLEQLTHCIQCVSGVEQFRRILRREVS